MKNKPTHIINRLSSEKKAIICDNCDEVDICRDAYNGVFRHKVCYKVFYEIKDDILDEEVEDYGGE